MWECPDLFPLGNKHVLIYSTAHKVIWHVGTLEKREIRFHAENNGLIDHGAYYAPKSMLDAKGRRILWGWVQETRSPEDEMQVLPEFASLQVDSKALHGPFELPELNSALSTCTIPPGRAHHASHKARQRGQSGLEVRLQSAAAEVALLTTAFSPASVNIGDQVLPLSPDRNGVSTLEIWLDASFITTFADHRHVITTRSYVAPNESGKAQVVWSGHAYALKSIEISGVNPISKDRLTTSPHFAFAA